jgi:hypothetical protein
MPEVRKISKPVLILMISGIVILMAGAFIWGNNSDGKTNPVVSTIENCLFYFWLLLFIFNIAYWIFRKVAK